MNKPTRVAVKLFIAAGAVVTPTSAASADAPPCDGWARAAAHSDAGPVERFNIMCNTEGAFKQGFPVKWSGGG